MLHRTALARVVWLAAAALLLGLAALTLPTLLREAGAVVPASERTFSQLSPAEAQVLARWGIGPAAYAVYVAAWTLAPLLIYLLIASLIVQRSRGESVAIWMSIGLVGIGGAMPYLGGITDFGPPWQPVVNVVRALGLTLLLGLFFIFPTGQFVPRWSRHLAWLWALWMLYWLLAPGSPWVLLDAAGAFTPVGLLASLAAFGAGISAQVYRYRHISTPLQRQQGKLFAFGFAAVLAVYMLAVVPYFVLPAVRAPGLPYLLYGLVWVPLLTRLAFLFVPLLIGFAVLRYRLWDIDVIIRRTLIYSALTSLLAAIYLGAILLLQPLFVLVTGRSRSPLLTVLTTLAVAALFSPLRGLVQQAIDRRFYRRKYDAGRALAVFSASLAGEVDAQQLSARLMQVVGDTLQPAHVSLWLKPPPPPS